VFDGDMHLFDGYCKSWLLVVKIHYFWWSNPALWWSFPSRGRWFPECWTSFHGKPLFDGCVLIS
jgi:hypothetical protein